MSDSSDSWSNFTVTFNVPYGQSFKQIADNRIMTSTHTASPTTGMVHAYFGSSKQWFLSYHYINSRTGEISYITDHTYNYLVLYHYDSTTSNYKYTDKWGGKLYYNLTGSWYYSSYYKNQIPLTDYPINGATYYTLFSYYKY